MLTPSQSRYGMYGALLLIVYGSLYPFSFSLSDISQSDVNSLFDFTFWRSSLSDALANVLLFIPFGLLFGLYKSPHTSRAVLNGVIYCFIFAYVVQIAQLCVAARVPYGADALWNILGFVVGLAAWALQRRFNSSPLSTLTPTDNISLLLMAGLFVVLLQPFVPTLDWGLVKANIKSAIQFGSVNLGQLSSYTAIYLGILLLLSTVKSLANKGLIITLGFATALFAQFFIVDSLPSSSRILAAVLAAAYYYAIGRSLSIKLNTVVMVALLAVSALAPFSFSANIGKIWLIPFAASLEGSMLVNVAAMVQKLALYASVIWLLHLAGLAIKRTTMTLATVVLTLEVIQLFIPYRSSDITDVILCLITGWVLALVIKNTSTSPSVFNKPNYQIESLRTDSSKAPYLPPLSVMNWRRHGKGLLLILVALTLGQALIMALPGLPYNVKELYGRTGDWLDYVDLSVALMIFGLGSIGLSAHFVQLRRSLLLAPVYCALISMTAFFFLQDAVSTESVADIMGYPRFYVWVMEDNLLGNTGVAVFRALGEDAVRTVTRAVEPYVRFAALTGPILYLIVWANVTLLTGARLLATANYGAFFRDASRNLLLFLPGFWLCKVIAFDFYATDNLIELIATDGFFGTGGGGYLYLLIAGLILPVVTLVWAFRFRPHTSVTLPFIVLLLAIPFNWFMLNNGLEQAVFKYGVTFSGVDFLLGGSRTDLLSETQLFIRWLLVNGVSDIVLFTGLWAGYSLFIDKHAITSSSSSEAASNPKPESYATSNPNTGGVWASIAVIAVLSAVAVTLATNTSQSTTTVAWAAKPVSMVIDPRTPAQLASNTLSKRALRAFANENGCSTSAIDPTLAQSMATALDSSIAQQTVLIGFSGSTPEQMPENTTQQWSTAVTNANDTLDRWLDSGKQVWGAIASSAYHDKSTDVPPCSYARTHVRIPETSSKGILDALNAGTFWADQGKILDAFDFAVHIPDADTAYYPGQISSPIPLHSSANVLLTIKRTERAIDLPVFFDLYTNCIEGVPTRYQIDSLKSFEERTEFALPLLAKGTDRNSCFVRARAQILVGANKYFAYTNHVRLVLD